MLSHEPGIMPNSCRHSSHMNSLEFLGSRPSCFVNLQLRTQYFSRTDASFFALFSSVRCLSSLPIPLLLKASASAAWFRCHLSSPHNAYLPK